MHAPTDIAVAAPSAAQLIADATAVLVGAGIDTARLDAEVLLAAAWGIDRTALCVRAGAIVPRACEERFQAMLRRRATREPLQYIVGRQEFWSLDFVVTPEVLIPRPETELLVELTLNIALGGLGPPLCQRGGSIRREELKLCDLGSGSGCIAVALARELPEAQIWVLDASRKALQVAATNARRHGVVERLRFVESDLCAAVAGSRFDAIVCNPPYVSSAELERAQPELAWEPRPALDGGPDGLDVIRRVLAAAPEYLVDGGWLLMEIGASQKDAVVELAAAARAPQVAVRPDYAGLPRVLLARW